MTPVAQRPQDRLRLAPGASVRPSVIEPRSTRLWTILSFSLIGYFIWYFRAQRDCSRLLDHDSDPWFWMAMLFPGMLLLIPYAAAQARIVARVEVATRRPLPTAGYLAVCVLAFVIPALLPLVLQPRLNQAARMDTEQLRRMAVR